MLAQLDMLHIAFFGLGATAGGGLSASLIHALLARGVPFWPAPDRQGWRHHVALTLFRVLCAAIVLVALVAVARHGPSLPHLALGLPMVVGAYGVTLWGYRSLGLDNTYGAARGLVTNGLYAYSRNPQYVSSVLASVGLAIAAASWAVLGLTAILLAVYTLFALGEERVLDHRYGQAFRDYMASTPRFIGLRSLAQAREDVEALLAR